MVLRQDGDSCRVLRLEIGGPVVGFRPHQYQRGEFSHEAADWALFFTDGISESMNPRDEEWGEERLIEIAKTCHRLSAVEGMRRIFDAALTFASGAPQHDDMTVVVLRVA